MANLSILIGGKAGFGIDKSSLVIAGILNRLGYRIYVYRDYPSLIRGGHTFSIIRASKDKIAAHIDKVDYLLALNQDAVNFHGSRLKPGAVVIYDSDSVKSNGIGIPLTNIIKEEAAPEILRNAGMIGAFCKASGIEWPVLEDAFRKNFAKDTDLNLKVARKAYDLAKGSSKIERLDQKSLPLLTGNEATGLGLIRGGLAAYIAYPMTPASPILHFMANAASDFSLKVIHPESEIAVILMALGFSYCGKKVAVGTSGGGFCLMTEGLSFSAMAELPVVIILGQRPGPSTGLPTYSAQTELHFALNAGQGEFSRFLVAPGDAEEAYCWSQAALNISWKFQVPSIILSDKNLGEGTYSFDIDSVRAIKEEPVERVFAPRKGAVIKVNSYEHDESGLTTEDPTETKKAQEKRLIKEKYIAEYLEGYETVNVYGNKASKTALLCWGSTKGPVVEAAEDLGLKVVHVIALSPFPIAKFKEALRGVKKLISVENNATGQLVRLINRYGFKADDSILKYDGRPFTVDELAARIKEVVK